MKKTYEDCAFVLSTDSGAGLDEVVYAIGENHFGFFVLRNLKNPRLYERLYLGKKAAKRKDGVRIVRKIGFDDLPLTVKFRVGPTLRCVVGSNEGRFFSMVLSWANNDY